MGVCRILGLVGSASCLVILCFFLEEGIPDDQTKLWAVTISMLVGYNINNNI